MQEKSRNAAENDNQTDNRSIEELFAGIEAALEKMQQEDVTLEESFSLYEQGIRDIRRCTQMLDLVEKKMMILTEDGGLAEE